MVGEDISFKIIWQTWLIKNACKWRSTTKLVICFQHHKSVFLMAHGWHQQVNTYTGLHNNSNNVIQATVQKSAAQFLLLIPPWLTIKLGQGLLSCQMRWLRTEIALLPEQMWTLHHQKWFNSRTIIWKKPWTFKIIQSGCPVTIMSTLLLGRFMQH